MAADSGRGRLRASQADREHVVGTLKAAYVYGLVTKDEFDARVSQTFASRTYAELALITADIPAGLAAAPPPPRPGPAKANPPARANVRSGDRAIIGTAVLAALAFVAALFAGNPVIASRGHRRRVMHRCRQDAAGWTIHVHAQPLNQIATGPFGSGGVAVR